MRRGCAVRVCACSAQGGSPPRGSTPRAPAAVILLRSIEQHPLRAAAEQHAAVVDAQLDLGCRRRGHKAGEGCSLVHTSRRQACRCDKRAPASPPAERTRRYTDAPVSLSSVVGGSGGGRSTASDLPAQAGRCKGERVAPPTPERATWSSSVSLAALMNMPEASAFLRACHQGGGNRVIPRAASRTAPRPPTR